MGKQKSVSIKAKGRLIKKNSHICPSGPTGGVSAKIPTSLTEFVCVRNELFEQTPRLVRPLGPNEDWPHQLFSTKVEHQYSSGRAKNKSVNGGPSGWGG